MKKNEHLFTPFVHYGTGLRAYMLLGDEDYAKVTPCTDFSTVVTDLVSGNRYWVENAECNFRGCCCAAVIIKRIGE
jgi:hypothetical protein